MFVQALLTVNFIIVVPIVSNYLTDTFLVTKVIPKILQVILINDHLYSFFAK